ncbi:MAG: SDR family oxidoreductase [Planctomycetes bacterium]|nr:SDR family oxidoreductase [Planctomycetota bacterium]
MSESRAGGAADAFLELDGKSILVCGVANRRSVAYHIARRIEASGGRPILSVRSEARREAVAKLFPERAVLVCDVEHDEQILAMRDRLDALDARLDGVVHSIAFADYEGGGRAFHETDKRAFLRAMDISCYSLIRIAGVLRGRLARHASVVTISISTTRMASENYGAMAPVKAALDSSIAFLAKSFSGFSEVRFNAVGAGLLKTSASAGIPGYVDSYFYAEQMIPRKRALDTREVADTALFLLSPRSSGINAQTLVVDAGMSINYFDRDMIRRAMRPDP